MAVRLRNRAILAGGAIALFAASAVVGYLAADSVGPPERRGARALIGSYQASVDAASEVAPEPRAEPPTTAPSTPLLEPFEPFEPFEPDNGEPVEVPSVLEMRVDAATSALEQVGFQVVVLYADVDANDPRAGRVLRMAPEAGATVEAGSIIHLTVGRVVGE